MVVGMENARTNRYASDCVVCGNRVPPGAGSLTRKDKQWVVRHTDGCVNPELISIPVGIDPAYIAFLGKLIMEEGGPENAWNEIAAMNEFWDGEDHPRDHERRKFEAALPFALAQNDAIHGARGRHPSSGAPQGHTAPANALVYRPRAR